LVPNIERRKVAYDSSNRLLLNALLKGLVHAIRRDDIPAANRYRGRLQQAAEPVAADSQLKGPLTKLLSTSGLWVRAANSERDETRQQLLDLIDNVVALLTS
jgi:hypothetical protein